MMNYKRHNAGISYIEVIIALAMFSIVCGVLLTTQGKSVETGMRAVYEQLVTLELLRSFVERDRVHLSGKDFCAEPASVELEPPAPVGTVTCTSDSVPEKSAVHKYPHMQRDTLRARWVSSGQEVYTTLVRFRFDPEVARET